MLFFLVQFSSITGSVSFQPACDRLVSHLCPNSQQGTQIVEISGMSNTQAPLNPVGHKSAPSMTINPFPLQEAIRGKPREDQSRQRSPFGPRWSRPANTAEPLRVGAPQTHNRAELELCSGSFVNLHQIILTLSLSRVYTHRERRGQGTKNKSPAVKLLRPIQGALPHRFSFSAGLTSAFFFGAQQWRR